MSDTRFPAHAHGQIHGAHAFFTGATGDHTEAGAAPPSTPPPAAAPGDAAGVRIFQMVTGEDPHPLAARGREVAHDLLELVGIAAGYVDRQARRRDNPSLQYDRALWEGALMNLPLMGPGSVQKESLARDARGWALSDELLPPELGSRAEALAPASAFRGFLTRQREAIRAGVARSPSGFTVILVRLVVAQEGPVYTGAGVAGRLECSFCDYTAREVRRDPGRADPAPPQVVFTADLRKVTRIFNADALHDPATRAQWEELLAKAPRQDVRKSGSFFEFHLPVPGSADARGAPSGGSA